MPTTRKNHCIYCDKFVNNGTNFCCEEHKHLYWDSCSKKDPKILEPITCECGKVFIPNRPNQIYCSKNCRNTACRLKAPKITPYRGNLPTGTIGAISELIVSANLAKSGYDVFRAVSPACFCDLIATKENKMLRIEVRTGRIGIRGKLSFPTNAHKDIDLFAVYLPEENIIFYFNPDLTETTI